MARTMICDANNRPVFSRPRKNPATGKTTPATRKAWLISQPLIDGSSVTEHSVVCKVCQNLIQLHQQFLFHVENWQKHVKECPREVGEPARKRRRTARDSESVTGTQMILRRRIQSIRGIEPEGIDNILSTEDPDETNSEAIVEDLENRPLISTQYTKPMPSDLHFRLPFTQLRRSHHDVEQISNGSFRLYAVTIDVQESSSRFPVSNERGSPENDQGESVY